MLRDENGMLTGYVYVDVAGRDVGSYVEEAKKLVREQREAAAPGIRLPGADSMRRCSASASACRRSAAHAVSDPDAAVHEHAVDGQDHDHRAGGAVLRSGRDLASVPLGYNMSIGVWVGLIALMGVDAETGVFMLLYLDLAYDEAKGRAGCVLADLQEAIMHGAVKRIRPKFMTVAHVHGPGPIMWSTGAGSDVMKRIAAPMIGGIFTSFLLELVVYPAIYEVWKWHFELKKQLA